MVDRVAYHWMMHCCWAMRMRLPGRACVVVVPLRQVSLQTEVHRKRSRVDVLWALQIEDEELMESRFAIAAVCLLAQ